MSINLTDEIEVKTKKGKLGAAKQIFLDGDKQTVEKEIQDINSRHNDLSSKHESLSSTVSEHTKQIESNKSQITANKSAQDAKNTSLEENMKKLNTRDDQITELLNGITASGGASVATAVTYDNTSSQLASATVQGAVDELQSSKISKTSISQESGDSEELIMSQKAISDKFSNLSSTITEIEEKANNASTDASNALTKAEEANNKAEDNKSTLTTATSDISELKKKVEDISATIPKVVSMSESAYDDLETKEPDTYYMLTEE